MMSALKLRSLPCLVALALGLSCEHDTLNAGLSPAMSEQDASAPASLGGSGEAGGAALMGGTGGFRIVGGGIGGASMTSPGGMSGTADAGPSLGGQGGSPPAGTGGPLGSGGAAAKGGSGGMTMPLTPLQIPAKDALYRLATFLGNGIIEDRLLKAFNDGRPRSVQDVGELTKELLQGQQGSRKRIEDFMDWWLQAPTLRGMNKADPDFANLVEAFAVEPRTFAANEIFDGEDSWRNLISAPATVFLSAAHARFYGLTMPNPPLLVRFPMLLPNQRAGVVTMPGVLGLSSLADRNSISRRGLYVRSHFLCQEIPPPPPGHPINLPPGSAAETLRERHLASISSPACAACHMLIDPTGLLFEGYDAVGRFRSIENGKPIDTSGRVEGIPLADAVALARWLATAPASTRCFAKKWLQFAIGPKKLADDSSIDEAHAAFATSGFHIRPLIVALTQTKVFLSP